MDRMRTAAQAVFIVSAFGVVAGVLLLADVGETEDNILWGLNNLSLAVMFFGPGFLVRKGSLLALVVSLTLYLGDSALWQLNKLSPNEARFPLGWAIFRIAMIVFMVRGLLSRLPSARVAMTEARGEDSEGGANR
jgi:hypothetical protein